jgi:hypothetical protein
MKINYNAPKPKKKEDDGWLRIGNIKHNTRALFLNPDLMSAQDKIDYSIYLENVFLMKRKQPFDQEFMTAFMDRMRKLHSGDTGEQE